MKYLFYLLIFIMIFTFGFIASAESTNLTKYTYKVINTYPHDKEAFTQGLYYEDGIIYEGTGRYGQSDMRKYYLDSNEILNKYELSIRYFGEGITLLNEKIYQSTWKARTIFIYDKNINIIKRTSFPFECWGLSDNDENLIMSDGSNIIRFLDPDTFNVLNEIKVTMNGKAVENINELEFINDKIYANIWQDDTIIIINPDNGVVEGLINLKGIINPNDYKYELNVLNGIAYDKKNDRLFVTGKLWPKIFEIELIPE